MSTDDRKLLELAAKAAGNGAYWGDSWQSNMMFVPTKPHPSGLISGVEWNPLTDDGDALRLAVKLSIRIYPPEPHMSTYNSKNASANVVGRFWRGAEVIDGDPYAATRRAIVRAAAAIGEQMP